MNPWTVRASLVLGHEPGPEQQRVVGAERDGRARPSTSARSGTCRRLGVDPERRRSTPGTPRARRPRSTTCARAPRGSSAARTPCPSRSGRRCVEHLARRAPRRAARRRAGTEARPARARDRERRARTPPCRPRRSSLLSPKPTTSPGPVAGVPRRQPREGARVERVAHARRRHDDADLDAGGRARRPGLVEHDLQRRRDAADERRVRRRVDLDLEPAATPPPRRPRPPRARCGACPASDAHARPRGVVEPLEPEPAALVGAAARTGRRSSSAAGSRTPVPVRAARPGSRCASTR